jgi:hypothetical protein
MVFLQKHLLISVRYLLLKPSVGEITCHECKDCLMEDINDLLINWPRPAARQCQFEKLRVM